MDIDHGDRKVLGGVELSVGHLYGQLVDVVRVRVGRVLEVGWGDKDQCSRGCVQVEKVLVVAVGYRIDEGIAVRIRAVHIHRED